MRGRTITRSRTGIRESTGIRERTATGPTRTRGRPGAAAREGPGSRQEPLHFGKMFPNLPAFTFSAQAAADLVATMEDQATDPAGTDQGSAEDNPGLPSEYAYLGQFLDHNLDFDQLPQPSAPVNPYTVINHESFRWDLNDVFGGGPVLAPQLYASDHKHLLIQGTVLTPNPNGETIVSGGNPNGVLDLPRNA